MKKFLRILLVWIPLGFIALSLLQVTLHKWAPVRLTPLMVECCIQGTATFSGTIGRKWVPLEDISPRLIRAILASEDARFFRHKGFDLIELKVMKEKHEKKGKPIRGCSTLSQQTAKNCFTWCTHTWVRKAFEAYYTVLIEKIWGKRRIAEVYLNVVEAGPGLFGVESASQTYFRTSAAKVGYADAAAIACCLPNPIKRNPSWVRRYMSTRCSEIEAIARQTGLEF